MLDSVHGKIELTEAILLRNDWEFGHRYGNVVTSTFRFGISGKIEGYTYKEEITWFIRDGIVGICQANGNLIWQSDDVFYDKRERICITLRTPGNSNSEFILMESLERSMALESKSIDSLGAANFLFPKDLQVTPTRFRRILLVGSCLTALYHEQLSQRAPDIIFDYLVFNFAGSLPENPPASPDEYDFQYVQIPLRSILSDRIIWASSFNEPGFAERILVDGRGIIDVMLASAMQYNVAHGILTFVSNFFVPQMPVAPSLALRNTPVDLAFIVRHLNDYISELVSKYKNAYLLDVNALADSIGKRYLLDDQIYFHSHAAIHFQENIDRNNERVPRIDLIPPIDTFYESKRDDFITAVYDQMTAAYRTINQIDQVKAVIFDLDNTLWRGQLAEHYRPGLESWPNTDGWPLGIWEAIHHLRARGILVALCSKNDHKVVEELWANVVRPEFLSLNDFVSVKINWQPKAENIQAIIQEFNIKPRSVVFVDDNPVERASVKAALPEIRVIGANPYLTRRILLWAPETQLAFLTNESIKRETMVRSQIVREETRSTMTRDQFLATLQCSVTLLPITSTGQAEFGRALELINKTNQFNTTGRRWTHNEIAQFLTEGGEILAFSVADKFSEYGLVGILLLEGAAIVQYVMSCRVLGMEVEEFVLARAVDMLRAKDGAVMVAASLNETSDNIACRELYAKCGFTMIENNNGTRLYRLEAGREPKRPMHIHAKE
ncbi:HAD-IIIC family phosphatase [Labrys neptuniae]